MTIWRAMIDAPSYVSEFAAKRTSTAIGYLYFVNTLLAFFMLLPFAIGMAVLAPSARTIANEQLRIAKDWYPDDLMLTISGGVLTTNSDGPVILDLPSEWSAMNEDTSMHAVVIDTNASVDDFASLGTYVLMTRSSLVIQDEQGMRIYPFSDMESDTPIIINEELVTELTDALRSYTPMLPWLLALLVALFLALLPWLVGFFLWTGNLFFLLWASLLLLIVSAAMGKGLRYGQLYRLGAYGVTNSLLLGFALTMTSLAIPWGTYVLFFAWMIFVLSRFPQGSTIVHAAPLPPAATTAMMGKSTPSAKSKTAKAAVKKPTKKGL